MIKPEDLRIGDLVRVSRDCMFLKDTLYIVTEIHPDRQYEDKKGVVSLKAVNDDEIVDVCFYSYKNAIDIEGVNGRDLNPDCW